MNNQCLPLLCSSEAAEGSVHRTRRTSTRRNGNDQRSRRSRNNNIRQRTWSGYRLRSHFQRRRRAYSDPSYSHSRSINRRRIRNSEKKKKKNRVLTALLGDREKGEIESPKFPSNAVLKAMKLAERGELTAEELEKVVLGDVLWCSNKSANNSDSPFLGQHDPILFEPLHRSASERFIFIRSNGTVVVFNVRSLLQYLLATGDFRDPESRLPFSDSDIKRLDCQRRNIGLPLPSNLLSLLTLKHNPKYFEERRFREQMLHDCSELCGALVSKMLVIGDCKKLPEAAKVIKMSYLFSEFTFTWKQYLEAEKLYVQLIGNQDEENRHSQNSLKHFLNMAAPKDIFFKYIKDKATGRTLRAEITKNPSQNANIRRRSTTMTPARRMIVSFLNTMKVSVLPPQVVVIDTLEQDEIITLSDSPPVPMNAPTATGMSTVSIPIVTPPTTIIGNENELML